MLSAIERVGRAVSLFWERVSVGTAELDDIPTIVQALRLWLEDRISASELAAKLPNFVADRNDGDSTRQQQH